jgi:hypothetical protein
MLVRWMDDVGTRKCECTSQAQWLTPVILATWEAEIRRIRFEARLGK